MGIIVDGTPFALVLPCLFAENFVTMDDYTHKPYFSAFLRIIRFFAFIAGAVSAGSLCRTVQLPPGNVPLGALAEYLFIGADYRLSRIRRVSYNVYPV